MSKRSTAFEVDRLAHEIAFEAAASVIDSHSIKVEEGDQRWLDLTVPEDFFPQPEELWSELRYLELRGALTRHPQHPLWVQIGDPDEE